YVLVYYLVVNNFRSPDQLRRLVLTLLSSAALVLTYGFYQYYCGVDASAAEWVDGEQFPELKVRIFSTLENPNLLAGFLVIMLSLVTGLGLYARTRLWRVLAMLLALALGVGLVLTYCRGAWLGLLAVVLVCGLVYDRRCFWVLPVVPLVLLFNQDALLERLLSIANPTDTSATLRMAMWGSTLEMIADKPLTGIGWGAYWMVFPSYDSFINDASTRMYHAHNTYLHLAAEIGLPGLTAFLLFVGCHARTALRIFRQKRQEWIAGLMLGILAAFAGMAVCGLTDHLLFSVQLSMLFWLLCSLVTVAGLGEEAGERE
ncbi:MAG TPA: O-antigen ligase family protein, partial [Patescibacteria group bacterium]|nr:O-antigen ligase family protein [Patescibacteria group bacterium]